MGPIKNIIFILILFVPFVVNAQDQEKLFIQTDKPFYHTGETVWFRIDVKPAGSSIAYIELLDSANTPVLQEKIKIVDAHGAGSFIIPADLSAGIYLLRGYTNWMKNYGADIFFTKSITIINLWQSPNTVGTVFNNGIPDPDIEIKTDKRTYHTREKVTIILGPTAHRPDNFKNASQFSISVYKYDSLPYQTPITSNQPNVKQQHNNFKKETRGNIITGKITNLKTGNPVPQTNCYLSVVGPVNMFYTTTSDSAGNVLFEINNVYDDNQVVLQTVDTNYRVEIDNGFSKEHNTIINYSNTENDYQLSDMAVSAQVQLTYNRNTANTDKYIGDTLPFYGYAEYNYVVDEYVQFSSIEDIFREYIRPVQMYKREGAMAPIIFLDKERRLMNHSPFVLIDNVPVFNMQKLMRIDPAKLQRIDVVDRPYWYRNQYYEGIISVFTKNRNPESYLSRHATVQDFKGLHLSTNFYSPIYDTEAKLNNRLPDFRNVLYWSPRMNNQPIEFYTSDLPGNYVVEVQSINANGEIVSKVARFVVE